MSIRITCPECLRTYPIADELGGRKVRCRDCGAPIVVDECLAADEGLATVEVVDEAEALQREPRPRPRPASEPEAEKGPRVLDVRKRPRKRWRFLLAGGLLALLAAVVLGGPWWYDWFGVNFVVADLAGWPDVPPLDGVPPGQTVTLHVIGVRDEDIRSEIERKLRKHGFSSAQKKDRLVINVGRVPDPEAFARAIDFGSVRKVEGRNIFIVAGPLLRLPADPEEVAIAIRDVKSDDFFRVEDAADRLSRMTPNESRREVAAALESRLDDDNPIIQRAVAKALGVWGDEESVPALVKAMRHRHGNRHAMRLLAKLGGDSAIEALAAQLEDVFSQHDAAAALKSAGPKAESAVLARLKNRDHWVRGEVCDILRVIGTARSIGPLEKVAAENDPFVTHQAEEAIREIRRRK